MFSRARPRRQHTTRARGTFREKNDAPTPGGPSMLKSLLAGAAALATLAAAGAASAQQTKVVLAMSGWTGFAPFTLAKEKNFFAKHGVAFDIKKMPTQARHAAMAAGEVQAIATTIDTHITYVAANVPVTQVLVIDSSTGGDGVIVKKG